MQDPSSVTFHLESVVRCPECGRKSRAVMPIDACQVFWDCPHCRSVVKRREGDCCVFCSYGSVPCPTVQAERVDG